MKKLGNEIDKIYTKTMDDLILLTDVEIDVVLVSRVNFLFDFLEFYEFD